MQIVKQILRFLFHRPDPDESPIIRLAMVVFALAASVVCVVAAINLHWVGFILFGIAVVMWYALFCTYRLMRDIEVIRLTPAARAYFDNRPLKTNQSVRLHLISDDGQLVPTVTLIDEIDREMDQEFRPHGISFVVDRRELPQLEETTIDCLHDEQGQGLIISSPNLAS